MKIAFLNFYGGVIFRGVETFVHELANRLSSKHQVTVYQTGNAFPEAKYDTVTINRILDFNAKNNNIPFANYFSRQIGLFTVRALQAIDRKAEILFPTNGQWQSFLCKAWAIRNGIKVVISGQSGLGFDDKINLFSFPDIFVALTDFQLKWARQVNRFVRIEKIPNGVDLEKFVANGPKIKLELPRPIILCVAALDFWKRNDLIIKAVSQLREGSLLLVGKGAEEERLRNLGNQLLPGKFKILSFSYDQMPAVYRSADVFTYATVPWESFGIVLVEALASGLPVVATDDPIRREIVGSAGIFVDPQNEKQYSIALRKVLNKNWNDIPRRQAEKFSWDIIAQKYDRLFRDLAGI